MRRPRIERRDRRAVFCHEPHARAIETLEADTRQYGIEAGSQDRVCSRMPVSRCVREGEFVAAAPFLPVPLYTSDENGENDLKTVRPYADRLEVHTVRLTIPGEIE